MTERYEGRPSPQIEARILGKLATLNYNNTTMYVFGEGFEHMAHAYITDVEETPVYIYSDPKSEESTPLFDILLDNGFPYSYHPYPRELDYFMYGQYTLSELERES